MISAANHKSEVSFSPAKRIPKNATKITLVPSTGVVSEISPRVRARKVKTWPKKKIVPQIAANPMLFQDTGSPPVNHHGAKAIAVTQFVIKEIRHGPTPRSVARFSISAANP